MKKIPNEESGFRDLEFDISNLFRTSIFGFRISRERGFSLIEVIIGTALILISLVGFVSAYTLYFKAGLRTAHTLKSSFLLQEGVEAVTLMRDDAWSNLSALSGGTWYYLAWNGSRWTATSTATTTDGIFTRTFKLDDVYRKNADKDIVDAAAGGATTLDPNAKRVTIRVISDGPAKEMVTYLTNLFE